MAYKKYAVSELFGQTVQGEGRYVGIPTAWVRFFSCNFKCLGFGQAHLPRDQWKDPAEEIDLTGINSLDELPVFLYGCDSAYSHYKRFRALAQKYSAEEICNKLEDVIRSNHNPNAKFTHPNTNQPIHLAFTGGEPMMQQTAIEEVIMTFANRDNFPSYVTVETNGTQRLRDKLMSRIETYYQHNGVEWFWSCSPKLSASGEKWEDAIKPEVLADYNIASRNGQLKFVVDGTQKVWDEVHKARDLYYKANVKWPVWIMPVGAANDQQEDIQAQICEDCFRRGFNFSPRVHCWIFGNCTGK